MKRGPHKYAQILDASYGALKSRQPAEPRDRRQHVHDRRRVGAQLDQEPEAAQRQAAADGHVRPQPVQQPPRRCCTARRSGTASSTSPTCRSSRAGSTSYLGRPRHHVGMKIFIAELMYPTDHRNFEFDYFVSRKTAASWLGAGAARGAQLEADLHAGLDRALRRPGAPRPPAGRTRAAHAQGKKKPAYFAYKNN